jgi:hypothetical protein
VDQVEVSVERPGVKVSEPLCHSFRTVVRTEFIDTTINHPVADEQTRRARMDEKLCEQP